MRHLGIAYKNTNLYNANLLMVLNEVQCEARRIKGY